MNHRMNHRISFLASLLALMFFPASSAASFQPGFEVPGLTSAAAVAIFDDGGGERIYAGGVDRADGVAGPVVVWNGATWERVAGPSGSVLGRVDAMIVFDDGGGPALYVGGLLRLGGEGRRIAKWDGTDWTILGAGLTCGSISCFVSSFAIFDDGDGPALFAAGEFVMAGGLPAVNIARWDGVSWSGLGDGPTDGISDLAVLDGIGGEKLYATGGFAAVGAQPANSMAAWDGSAWSNLPGPSGIGLVGGEGYGLAVYPEGGRPQLWVRGFFATAGGLTTPRLALWDGAAWSAPPAPMAGLDVDGFAALDLGTGLELFLSLAGLGVQKWDGGVLTPIGELTQAVDFAGFDDAGDQKLVAVGFFHRNGDTVLHSIGVWDGGSWSALSNGEGLGVRFRVNTLTLFDDGDGEALYAGGTPNTAGTSVVGNLGKYSQGAWSPVRDGNGDSVVGEIECLEVFDDGSGPLLVIAGDDLAIGPDPGPYALIAWDGTSWTPFADQPNGDVMAMEVFDGDRGPALYVGGSFSQVGSLGAQDIAKWDGSAWTPLPGSMGGNGVQGFVSALEASADRLYVGGTFTQVGGFLATESLALWDGVEWSRLPRQLDGFNADLARVKALEIFDAGDGESLFVGGDIESGNGATLNNIGRWDAVDELWKPVGGGLSAGSSASVADVKALYALDVGDGPSLFVAGFFGDAGGQEVSNIARWDGQTWSALSGPEGEEGLISIGISVDMVGFADGSDMASLFVGGSFSIAGGLPSEGMARFQVAPEIFAGDFESGSLAAWSMIVGDGS